jgi:hypothetical protein
MSQDKYGWVYCISNESYREDLLKIGMTERTPQERLAEANRSDTWRPPLNYKLEFAKYVKDPLKKEKTLHKLFEQYNERVNNNREFFKVSVEKARLYFDLMDGDYLELSTNIESASSNRSKTSETSKSQKGGNRTKTGEIAPTKPKSKSNSKHKNKTNTPLSNIIIENNSKDELEILIANSNSDSDSDSSFNPKKDLENNPKQLELLENINIKDLSIEESKKLLKIAINREALNIKIGKKFNRFYELINIKPNKIKNMVFEAHIVAAPDGINSIDEDAALFINNSNYKTIVKTLKNASIPHVIILTELYKL